ncbi:MAG TPA: AraC family transcriptional regulator [Ohtaekwangia sp.]|uniref:helix-turn-helix domain-containing protein n=1 Tax=Ohtaekwangia sp. TaxID=2066019 RepID=UPI002F94AE99
MTTYSLPEDLLAAKNQPGDDLIVFDYQTTNKEPVKTRIVANKHVFSFLQEGEKEVHFYDQSVRFTPTKALLIPTGNSIMTERYSEARQYRSLLFMFSDNNLGAFRNKYVSLFTHASRNTSERLSHFLFMQDDFIKNFVRSLQHIHTNPSTLSASLLQIKFDEIMLYLCDQHPQFLNFLLGVNASDLSLRKVVESETSINLSLEELSFLCNMSVSTFKRKFEEVYGMAPSRWFHLKKMQQAAFMLKHEKAKASEIHHELGYENLSSFVQAFKKEFGKTPKAYQQNV